MIHRFTFPERFPLFPTQVKSKSKWSALCCIWFIFFFRDVLGLALGQSKDAWFHNTFKTQRNVWNSSALMFPLTIEETKFGPDGSFRWISNWYPQSFKRPRGSNRIPQSSGFQLKQLQKTTSKWLSTQFHHRWNSHSPRVPSSHLVPRAGWWFPYSTQRPHYQTRIPPRHLVDRPRSIDRFGPCIPTQRHLKSLGALSWALVEFGGFGRSGKSHVFFWWFFHVWVLTQKNIDIIRI